MKEAEQQGLRLYNEQSLKMSAAQLQSLSLLAMTGQQLEEYLQQQLLDNPVLEQSESASDPLPTPELPAADDSDEPAFDRWQHLPRSEAGVLAALAGVAQPEKDALQRYLLLQAPLNSWPTEQQQAFRAVVWALDNDGYLRQDLGELSYYLRIDPELLRQALRRVQALDPPGVGARTLAECLSLQIPQTHPQRQLLEELVEDHLAELADERFRSVAKIVQITPEEVERLYAVIRSLTPRPGAPFDRPDRAQYIVPDLLARKRNGKWIVELWDETRWQVRINDCYRQMLSGGGLPQDSRVYLRQNLSSARQLISNLQRRHDTLLSVTKAICEYQDEFFDQGPSALRPLTLRQVAEAAQLHESTVSRALAGKYLDSPRGILALRTLFSRSYQDESGASVSAQSIRQSIAELVAAEDKQQPLSDEAIREKLAARGLPVARRTIAKYRSELRIPGRSQRRRSL